MNIDNEISITYMSGPRDGRILRFDQPEEGEEEVFTIGRRDNCDVPLPFDNQVSRLHARLGCISQPATSGEADEDTAYVLSFWLEDMNSRNGTFIEKGAKPIRGRNNLRPGALFRIGRTWLRLDIPFSMDGDNSW